MNIEVSIFPPSVYLYCEQSSTVQGTIINKDDSTITCFYRGETTDYGSLGSLPPGGSIPFSVIITAPATGRGSYTYYIYILCIGHYGERYTQTEPVSVSYREL